MDRRRALVVAVVAVLVAAAAVTDLVLSGDGKASASHGPVTLTVGGAEAGDVSVEAHESETGPNPGWHVLEFGAVFDVDAPKATRDGPLRLIFEFPPRAESRVAIFHNAVLLADCEGAPPRGFPCISASAAEGGRQRTTVLALDASTRTPPALEGEEGDG